MNQERWREISELAAAAAESAPGEREAILRANPELRGEVESLLCFMEEESGPLDQPPSAATSSHFYEDRRIGAYRVVRELGQGGMGVVLLAERDDGAFQQQVAIKLSRVSFQTEYFQRRFVEERQILARLEHPHIVRLLDGGLNEDGTPYLVMQYVEGEPLLAWCAARALSIQERITLMLQVFDAVESAHDQLIVHRDLKPGNILVNRAGHAVLLDFGTAQLLASGEQAGAAEASMPLVTARYASPEQVRGLAGGVRTDVYSLGAVLYELLTGAIPYQVEAGNVPALLRAVSEQEPIPPSQRADNPALRRRLAGDLDAILLRALEKAPERRYASVREFGLDLRRHLAGEAVEARRAGWPYRATKFVRRHRWAAAAASVAMLSLAAATVFSARQARAAEQERVKAVQVAAFLESLLGGARPGALSPLASGGREVRMVDVVEAAARRIGEEFRDNPDVEAGLQATVGGALVQLGQAKTARPHVERAVELSERLYGDAHAATVRALTVRGTLRLATGEYAEAQRDLERTLAWYRERQHPDLSFQHGLVAESYFRRGNLRLARQHWEAALASMRKHFGERHVSTATMLNNLANVSANLGDMAGAERYFTEAAAAMRTLPGPPGNLVYPLFGLARAHFFRGEYSQARQLLEEAYGHAKKTGGARHPNTASAAIQLATLRAYSGEAGGEDLAREAISLLRSIHPPGHTEIARGLIAYGRILIVRGKAAAALPVLSEAYAIDRKLYPKDNWRPAEAQFFRGVSLALTGHHAEGNAAVEAGLREMRATLAADHPRLQEAVRIQERCRQAAAANCLLP